MKTNYCREEENWNFKPHYGSKKQGNRSFVIIIIKNELRYMPEYRD